MTTGKNEHSNVPSNESKPPIGRSNFHSLQGLPQVKITWKPYDKAPLISDAEAGIALLRNTLPASAWAQQQVYALFINAQGRLLTWKHISTGTATEVKIDTALILHICLRLRVTRLIIARTSPDGSLQPTEACLQCIAAFQALAPHLLLGTPAYYVLSRMGHNLIGSSWAVPESAAQS